MNLPYKIPTDVKVFPNEYINANTMNRALLRLYYNDLYLSNLASLDPVDTPTVANSLLVSISSSEYTWMTADQVKTTLAITDSLLGLSDVDIDEIAIEHNQGISWDATKSAFVAKAVVDTLVELSDTIISSPTDNEVLLYSAAYGKFINGNPGNYSVGYITNIIFEEDGKALVDEITNIAGQQVSITKIGTATEAYFVPHVNNKINGETGKALKSSTVTEENASIHLRSVARDNGDIEWVTISGDGTWDLISASAVPGTSIINRLVTETELMLQPYTITYDNVPDATEAVKGIIQIASDAEATAGTDIGKAITPQQLKFYFDNYATVFASNAEYLIGTSETKSATVKQIRDESREIIATYSPAFYQLDISPTHNYILPSDFVDIQSTTDLYSRGMIETGVNNIWAYSVNSMLYSMNIKVTANATIDFKLYEVDDDMYIYIDGSLVDSNLGCGAQIPVDMPVVLIPGEYLLQIVKNDSGGGTNRFTLHGNVIQPDIEFVYPY